MSALSSLLFTCILGANVPVSPELGSEVQAGAELGPAAAPGAVAKGASSQLALNPRELRFGAPELKPHAPKHEQDPPGPLLNPGQTQQEKAPREGQKEKNPQEDKANAPKQEPTKQEPQGVKPPSPRYDSKTAPPPRYDSDQRGFDRRRRRRPSSRRGGRSRERRSYPRGRNEFRTSRSSRSYDSQGRHYDSRRESDAVNRRYQSDRTESHNRRRGGSAPRRNASGAQRASYRNQSPSRNQRQQQIRVRQGGPNAQGHRAREDRPHMVELGYGPYGGWWGGEISYLYHLQGGSEGPAVGAIVSGASIGGSSSFSLGGKFQWDFSVMEEEQLDFFAAPFAGVSYQWASTLRSDVGVTVRAVFEDRWIVFIQPAVLSLYTYVGGGDVARRFLPVYHGAAGIGVLF